MTVTRKAANKHDFPHDAHNASSTPRADLCGAAKDAQELQNTTCVHVKAANITVVNLMPLTARWVL